MRFTSAGIRLLELADEVLPRLHKAELDLQRFAGGETGRIIMAIECHSCFEWLLPAIDAYRNEWSDVELISPVAFICAAARLSAGRSRPSDYSRSGRRGRDRLLSDFSYEAQLAIAKNHSLVEKPWIEPEDLANEVVITYPVDQNRLDLFTGFCIPPVWNPRRCDMLS